MRRRMAKAREEDKERLLFLAAISDVLSFAWRGETLADAMQSLHAIFPWCHPQR